LSTPRFSASQIIAAPMRHLTEYDGLRPSILANTVALAPSVMRFNFTSGVPPIDNELSLKNRFTCSPHFIRLGLPLSKAANILG
jgi:hypothetical protein